jgi:hypothetical protein
LCPKKGTYPKIQVDDILGVFCPPKSTEEEIVLDNHLPLALSFIFFHFKIMFCYDFNKIPRALYVPLPTN